MFSQYTNSSSPSPPPKCVLTYMFVFLKEHFTQSIIKPLFFFFQRNIVFFFRSSFCKFFQSFSLNFSVLERSAQRKTEHQAQRAIYNTGFETRREHVAFPAKKKKERPPLYFQTTNKYNDQRNTKKNHYLVLTS